jgi:hypothetical protein
MTSSNGTGHQPPQDELDDLLDRTRERLRPPEPADYGDDLFEEEFPLPAPRPGSRCNRENGENRENRDNRGLPPKGGVRGARTRGAHDAEPDAPPTAGAHHTPAPHTRASRGAPSPLSLFSLLQHNLGRTLPQHPGQWERALFRLARELKAVVPDARPQELRAAVREWHDKALAVAGDKAWADTWSLFLVKWKKARVPAGVNPVDAAWERARAAPPPERAVERYDEGPIVMLAALCRELQREVGEGEFFIDCRTAAGKIGVHYATAWRYLGALCEDGLLEAGEKGHQATADAPGKASRFRYLGG